MRKRTAAVLAGVAAAAAGAVLYWRWSARRRNMPCPTWLAPRFGNRLYNRITQTEATLEELALRPGLRVLDLGAGWGRLAVPAAQRVAPGAVVALDLQPAMLSRLQAAAADVGVANVMPVIAEASHLPFRDGVFDLVYLSTVLGEIPDRDAALGGCYRVLRPGGRLSVTEMLPDPHYQSRRTVRRLAEAAGFAPATVHGRGLRFNAVFARA